MSIKLCDGKYEFWMPNPWNLQCKRNGEEWRSFVGDKAVHALYERTLELEARLSETAMPESCAHEECRTDAGHSNPCIYAVTAADIEEFRTEHVMAEEPGDEPWVAKHNRVLAHLCRRATPSAIAESFPKSPAASTNRPENGEASKNGLRQPSDIHSSPEGDVRDVQLYPSQRRPER